MKRAFFAALCAALTLVAAPATAQQMAGVTEYEIGTPQSAAAELDRYLTPPKVGVMVVYFHAPDCPPCQRVASTIDAFKEKWRHEIRLVNVGGYKPVQERTRAWTYAVRARGLPDQVPLLVLFVNGQMIATHMGSQGLSAKLAVWQAAYH